MIIYTDRFQFKGFDAHAILSPLILIRPNRRGDAGIIAHERRHAKDVWLCGWLICGLLYKFSRRFRLWFELRGFREEIKVAPERLAWAAKALSNDYRLGISGHTALKLLK